MEDRIIIVGGGTMGQSIGRLFRTHGWAVHAVDSTASARDAFARTVPGATTGADLNDAGQARLALECVPEDLALKQKVMAALDAHMPDDTPILSNTSGLTLSEMSVNMVHPERALIAHFFNPGDVVPAVEVVAAKDVPEGLCDAVMDILRALGRRPVQLYHAPLGFVANRIQHAIMRECLHLVDEGVADPAAIDEIVQWSIGIRMALAGPFRQRDLNGLGTHLSIATYLYPDLSDRHTPSPTLADKVARGELGRRVGKGFFDWASGDAVDTDDDALRRVIDIARDVDR
jgi:3-hydroxybutyryl-CoA dehydrogenase